MEAMGVFSSCVTALIKLSCCSLSRISRTRKLVFRISPAMMATKKITPKKNSTPSRQLRMIQPTLQRDSERHQADAQHDEKRDRFAAARRFAWDFARIVPRSRASGTLQKCMVELDARRAASK